VLLAMVVVHTHSPSIITSLGGCIMGKSRFLVKKAVMLVAVVALGVHASVANAKTTQCGVKGASVGWTTSTEWSWGFFDPFPFYKNIFSGTVRSVKGSCVTATLKYPNNKTATIKACGGTHLPFRYELPMKYLSSLVSVSCKKS